MHIRDDWQTLAQASRFVVFDTETTGLDPLREELIEIGAVIVSQGDIIAQLSLLIKPTKPIPPEAGSVNGITDEMVAKALPLQEALACFEFFIADYPLVAHNAQFDVAFVQQALGYELPNPTYCTSNMARKMLPRQKRFSLNALCRLFDIQNEQAHRASSDAEATARVAIALLAYGMNPPPLRHFAASGKNTYAIRETLKQLGFRWAAEEKLWTISLEESELPEALTGSEESRDLKIYGIECKELQR